MNSQESKFAPDGKPMEPSHDELLIMIRDVCCSPRETFVQVVRCAEYQRPCLRNFVVWVDSIRDETERRKLEEMIREHDSTLACHPEIPIADGTDFPFGTFCGSKNAV